MKQTLLIIDGRDVWHEPLTNAAQRRGWSAKRLLPQMPSILDEAPSGIGFIRPHPAFLPSYSLADEALRSCTELMVQDRQQVEVYEDKREQFRRWGFLMPRTWIFDSEEEALAFDHPFPVMSKADEGASSVNVRYIKDRDQRTRHIKQIFSEGIEVNRCADGHKTRQTDYVYFQQFIPHDRTYRVNIIGNRAAIFERFNYPDRPMAQTGNTKGVMEFTPLHDSLLKFAWEVADTIGSRWVALDILQEGEQWRLIETSLAWPWTPKDYSDVPFVGGGVWGDLWDVLLDEVENGSFESI